MATTESPQKSSAQNPKEQGKKPGFEEGKIPYPGLSAEMREQPDYGETAYKGLGRLEGKTALVTGADSGIGRAVAIAFAREGADVALSYLPEEEKDAAETEKWVTEAGRKALRLPGDLREETYCTEVVERTVKELGKLDLLANIAAFQSTRETLEEFTTEEFDRAFKTNIYSLFWLTKAALKHLKEGSAIINTTSIQGYDPSPNLVPYAATKSAIISMTKTISNLAMKRGIRVNAVAPGPVWTPLIPATMPEEKVKEFGKNTAFERPAQPVELAPLYVFLASNESRYVTGEVYGATGGRTPY